MSNSLNIICIRSVNDVNHDIALSNNIIRCHLLSHDVLFRDPSAMK